MGYRGPREVSWRWPRRAGVEGKGSGEILSAWMVLGASPFGAARLSPEGCDSAPYSLGTLVLSPREVLCAPEHAALSLLKQKHRQ